MLVSKEVGRFVCFKSEAAKLGKGKTFMAIKHYGKRTSAQAFILCSII